MQILSTITLAISNTSVSDDHPGCSGDTVTGIRDIVGGPLSVLKCSNQEYIHSIGKIRLYNPVDEIPAVPRVYRQSNARGFLSL
jgi:hypothetical protein